MTPIKYILAVAALAITAPLNAASLLTGYDVLIFNNFTASGATSAVPIAIGGNAVTSSFVFDQSANPAVTGGYETVVGKNLTMTAGSPSPVTYVGGTASLTTTSCNVGCVQTGGSSPVDFSALQSQYQTESTYLSGLTNNGTAVSQFGGLYFSANTTGQSLYVFSVNASQLTSGYFNFSNTGTATVLVNVNGSIPSTSSIVNTSLTGTTGSNVIFNFYNASQVTFTSFGGSILAPYATINGNSGSLQGMLIGNSFNGGSSSTTFSNGGLFSGSIPTAVPEPSSAFLLGAGILMGFGSFRFARKGSTRTAK